MRWSSRPSDHWLVPAAKTHAPLAARYLTALTVAGWPGGGVVARRRPSSRIQLSPALVTVVELRRLTPLGWKARYWAWVGTASHSHPTRFVPMFVVTFVAIPVLRQMRSPENSPLALLAGTPNGQEFESLSPTYMLPQSEFSGSLGPTRPPGGALESPFGAPLSRHVVV